MQRNLRTIVFSLLLIAAGVLALLSNLKILPIDLNHNYPLLVAGFGLGGLAFLAVFVTDVRDSWWASIPSLTLLGLALLFLTVNALGGISAALFIGMIALSFWLIYLTHHDFWWAIIPGGVLVTLAFISLLGDVFRVGDSGGIFFVGLGLTFVLVAVLASLQWAWIPGIILLVMGALIGTPFLGSMNLIWPAALIVGGLLLIFQFARRR